MPTGPKAIAIGDSATVKLWDSDVTVGAIWNSQMLNESWGFAGPAKNGKMICTTKNQVAGNKVVLTMRGQMSGHGTVDGAPVEGLGGHYPHFTDEFEVHLLTSEPFEEESEMDDQHVEWDVAEEGKAANIEWWNVPLNSAFHLQATGYTCTDPHEYYRPASRIVVAGEGDQYSGMNAVNAANLSDRIYRPNSKTTDESLTASNDVFSLDLVDEMAARIQQLEYPFRPPKWAGGELWPWFIHTDQHHDLMRDARYQAIQDAIIMGGGDYSGSSYANNSVKNYKGFAFIVGNWNPPGVHSTAGTPVDDVRRSWIGAQGAFGMRFGGNYSINRIRTKMGYYNRGGAYYCLSRLMWGAKRLDYNSKAYGVYVIPTRATNRGDAIT